MKWLIIAVLGYLLYRAYAQKNGRVANDDTLTMPSINSDLQTQPQQKYYQPTSLDPRVDRANQPWYIGERQFEPKRGKDIFIHDEGFNSTMSYGASDFWASLNQRYADYH